MNIVVLKNYDEFINYFNNIYSTSSFDEEGLTIDIQGDIDFSGKPLFLKTISLASNKKFKLFSSNGSGFKNVKGTYSGDYYFLMFSGAYNASDLFELCDLSFNEFDITTTSKCGLVYYSDINTQGGSIIIKNLTGSFKSICNDFKLFNFYKNSNSSSKLSDLNPENIIFNLNVTCSDFVGFYYNTNGSTSYGYTKVNINNAHFYGRLKYDKKMKLAENISTGYSDNDRSLYVNSGFRGEINKTGVFDITTFLFDAYSSYGYHNYMNVFNCYLDVNLKTSNGYLRFTPSYYLSSTITSVCRYNILRCMVSDNVSDLKYVIQKEYSNLYDSAVFIYKENGESLNVIDNENGSSSNYVTEETIDEVKKSKNLHIIVNKDETIMYNKNFYSNVLNLPIE